MGNCCPGSRPSRDDRYQRYEKTGKRAQIQKGVPLPAAQSYVVQNVCGTTPDVGPSPGGWLGWFEAQNSGPEGRASTRDCVVQGCGGAAEVGAHVWIQGLPKKRFYFIVPFCQSCNKNPKFTECAGDGWVHIKSRVRPVPTPFRKNTCVERK